MNEVMMPSRRRAPPLVAALMVASGCHDQEPPPTVQTSSTTWITEPEFRFCNTSPTPPLPMCGGFCATKWMSRTSSVDDS